ncbi:sideroflexin-4 [Thalassophryne amazonica]|uniref:sideroflexin-4 n=1 Tax=Thalassophryne amazonica TaxID=390379 RepID=UPI001471DE9D|nr:sideroflexin-4 [Thalassophryne amazonica]
MDPNLLYWKSQGQSFFSRLKIWFDLLDPLSLLSSENEIQNARAAIENAEKFDKKDDHAVALSLTSVHADSGAVLPKVFRPPAVLPLSALLVAGSCLPHRTVKPALFWQLLMHTYYAGFNYANRNRSSEKCKTTTLKHALLISGTVSYAAVAGVLPQVIISRLDKRSVALQNFFRFVVPVPLLASLAAFSVLIVRSEESDSGIQVFDSSGNPVCISKAAGRQAVIDTACSRAALMGTSAAVPNLLVFLLRRRNSQLVSALSPISFTLVFGLMIPVSFSIFSQLGTIKKENLEEELQAAASDGHLFYHRGL